jgi:hypothetical protein
MWRDYNVHDNIGKSRNLHGRLSRAKQSGSTQ